MLSPNGPGRPARPRGEGPAGPGKPRGTRSRLGVGHHPRAAGAAFRRITRWLGRFPTGWVPGGGTTADTWWPGRPTPRPATAGTGPGPGTPPRAVGWRAGLGRHSNRGKSGYSSVSVARGCGRGRESCPLPPDPLTERSPNTTDDQPEPPPAAGLRTPPWPTRVAPARAAKRTGQIPCGCHHD